MRSLWIFALAASGCRSILGIGDPPALIDSGGPGACADWHLDDLDPCALPPSTPALTLGDGTYTYDTTGSAGGTLYDAAHQVVLQSRQAIQLTDGSPIAVLSVGQLASSAGTRLAVIGPRPLLIVSWSSIVLDGVIDAGSHLGVTDATAHIAQTVQFGAGANQRCDPGAGHEGGDAPATGGSGGGGGGGLHAAGGAGGRGGSTGSGSGGAGGQAAAPAAAPGFHGGCPGGNSGVAGGVAKLPASPASRALGGAGGGALRLVARDAIEVRGSISANGAGGAGAPLRSACGGGGGGAGGYLGFEAPIVQLGGSITANGGGGAGGGDVDLPGNDGADGAVSTQAAPGGGLASSGCGAAGGPGAAAAVLAGADAASTSCNGGGGGGGGATGFIVIKSPGYTPGTVTLSPAAVLQ
ncbi:MAG TPA: hypothetical protein VGD37_36470 [Kofleriaceae bacterium]